MPISKTVSLLSGVVGSFHAVTQVSFFKGESGMTCQLTVDSWSNQTQYEDGDPAISREVVVTPLAPSADLFVDAEDALIAGATLWNGGTYLDVGAPTALEAARVRKWAELELIRDGIEQGQFTYDGDLFSGDLKSQIRLQAAARRAQTAIDNSTTYSVNWTLANNTLRVMDQDDLIAADIAHAFVINSAQATGRTLFAAIQAATTVEDVEAIVWP